MNSEQSHAARRRCVLFVIDALSEAIIREWIEAGRLPTIAKLLSRKGTLHPCISVFPSITPAATCSIATGSYPRETHIEGACWYDPEKNDAAYYGDDLKLALQEGFHDYLVDFGDRLNFERLNAPTVYEYLHEDGIDSACVNFMWFRGPHVHRRDTPWLLRWTAGGLPKQVMGPRFLKLGDFVHELPEGTGEVPGMTEGLTGRYGFHDKTTAACMMAMAKAGTLPDFSLAYFPLNDDVGHEEGLHEAARQCVEQFDSFLGDFIEELGGWELVGRELSFLIVGDHSQTEWREEGYETVRLDELLQDYQQADTAAGMESGDQLLICPNMRAAVIYLADESIRQDVLRKLRETRGIDQVIHQEIREGQPPLLSVQTRERGRLTFARASELPDDPEPRCTDRYGNEWVLFGELNALDLSVDEQGTLVEGVYPNPLERIEGAFREGISPIWVSADSGVELVIQETRGHRGGSHGSLHRDDSTAALICTPDIDPTCLPDASVPRIVDVLELTLKSLGAHSAKGRTPAPTPVTSS